MDQFIKRKLIRGIFFGKYLLFILILFFILFLSALNIKAQSVDLFWSGKAKNNIMYLAQVSDSSNFELNSLNEIKFSQGEKLTHRILERKGIQANYYNFSLKYYNLNNYNIYASDSALSFINRLNYFNYINEFNDVEISEEKIDFNILKVIYVKEIIKKERFTLDIYSNFNYFQGNEYEYNNYDLNINIAPSNNPFHDQPLVVNGTGQEYFSTSANNEGFGFGFGVNTNINNNVKFNLYFDNIGAFIVWEDLQFDNLNIDSETAQRDEFNNLNYKSSLTGRWEKFNFKMRLPLKINMDLSKEFNKFILSSDLNWQEYILSDSSRNQYISLKNSVSYQLNRDNIISIAYDIFTNLYNLEIKNKNFDLNLYADDLRLSKINYSGFEFAYNLNF